MNDRSKTRKAGLSGLLSILLISFTGLGSAQEDASDPLWFESHIAPLLARHCLECHDSGVRKGRLDLADPEKAFAAKGGTAIVPGDAEASLIWESIVFEEMPKDRPLLNEMEKELLRKWIDAGAVWSGGPIDAMAQTYDPQTAVNWVRRLTVEEYIETVRGAVGVDIESEARRILPPDERADGFQNTAYNLTVDLGHVEAYARLAAFVASKVDAGAFAERFTDALDLDDESMRELIGSMGKWLLRGPLDEQEMEAYLQIPSVVREDEGDFAEAASWLIEAMLQSPRFVYRMEDHQGDGSLRPATDYELASRLSYTLWGAPPDDALMNAAAEGKLSEDENLEAQVQRMLEDPRAVKQSRRFLYEWMDLGRLDNLRPDPERFPVWSSELAEDMRAETLEVFEEVIWRQKRPLVELLRTPLTYATPRLARHYGLGPELATDIRVDEGPYRVEDSMVAYYRFKDGEGDVVRDSSGRAEPLDLKIDDPSAVEWTSEGLRVKESTILSPASEPDALRESLQKSKALTLEAWVTTADVDQDGPARILTFSGGTSDRNFTLGQEGERYEVRIRTDKRDNNGLPRILEPGKSVRKEVTHIVFTRDTEERGRMYIDGAEVLETEVEGDFSNWNEGFRLALGNEASEDREWLGTFHSVAIYDRALSGDEVMQNHEAGSDGDVLLPAGNLHRYDLTSVPSRGGLLTHGSVLTIGGDEGSMVARGLFVLKDLLHSTVGNAPPGVDTTPVPPTPGQSQRAIATIRLNDSACSSCHQRFEPLAFAWEKYNGIGAWSEEDEHGNSLREDGEILFPGSSEPVPYETTSEFVNLLAESDRVKQTLTRKLAQFALGHPLGPRERPSLDQVHAAAMRDGGTYTSLITALVMSDLIRKIRTEPQS